MKCDKNTFSAAGATSCTPCNDGEVDDGDQTECGKCSP